MRDYGVVGVGAEQKRGSDGGAGVERGRSGRIVSGRRALFFPPLLKIR